MRSGELKRAVRVVVAALVLGRAGEAGAHHSYTAFFDYFISVEGTIQRVVYANPHTILTVRTKEGILYTANWRAAFQLSRMGVDATTLKPGDVIVMSGTPSRDLALRQLARIREVRRPLDGWMWRLGDN